MASVSHFKHVHLASTLQTLILAPHVHLTAQFAPKSMVNVKLANKILWSLQLRTLVPA